MINIDNALLRAGEAAGGWSADTAVEIARDLGGRIEWDDGAGEAWLRVLDAGAVVAYVSTEVPLAIVEARAAGARTLGPAVRTIVVSKMADAELSSSGGALEAAFGRSARLDSLDREAFSADDLWYVTV